MVEAGPEGEPERRIVDRRDTAHGELVLRRDGDDFEIVHDGMFLMDTRNGESERLLVTAALDMAGEPTSVLLGGLGVGFSLDQAIADDRLERITVVELHPVIVEWNRTHLGERAAERLSDDRVTIVTDDLVDWVDGTDAWFDVICLDVDNGPDWLAVPSNDRLYSGRGIAALAHRLAPDGVLAIWSAARSDALATELGSRFRVVSRIDVEVPRGEPDVIYLARGRLGGERPDQASPSIRSTNASARPM